MSGSIGSYRPFRAQGRGPRRHVFPDDVAQLKGQLLKPDDGPNERTPQGQARPNVLFEAGLAMGRRPAKTVLIRPVGHISRLPPPDEQPLIPRLAGLCG